MTVIASATIKYVVVCLVQIKSNLCHWVRNWHKFNCLYIYGIVFKRNLKKLSISVESSLARVRQVQYQIESDRSYYHYELLVPLHFLLFLGHLMTSSLLFTGQIYFLPAS